MSVVDQLKNLFSKKHPESELDSRLSLAMADDPMGAEGNATVLVPQAASASGREATAKEAAARPAKAGDLIKLAVLGERTVEQHQRVLSMALGVSLLLLAGLTFYALSHSNRVAQQLGATRFEWLSA